MYAYAMFNENEVTKSAKKGEFNDAFNALTTFLFELYKEKKLGELIKQTSEEDID